MAACAPATHPVRLLASFVLLAALAVTGCSRGDRAGDGREAVAADAFDDAPSPTFRNVAQHTAYVGDSACAACHASEAASYARIGMAQSFHRWLPAGRIETPTDSPLVHRRTGLRYAVVEEGGRLWQVERVQDAASGATSELRRPIDYVIGSGRLARSYFTSENGRLFQLPLTWYRGHGWDFSPGYDVANARFDRLLPDRCVACHASYPVALPHLEGKYAELRPGIGCERCHGPGALHVQERVSHAPVDSGFDRTIVNPARLPVARRLDVCEQCHVHTEVAIPREGRTAFSYLPSERLSDQYAFFRKAGSIDVVSHADRLRQSRCFLATRTSARPLECATCHDPHAPAAPTRSHRQPCLGCHETGALVQRVAASARADHAPSANCVGCHMPRIAERIVPHGTFTEHWIRVPGREPARVAARTDSSPVEPYYARDRSGPGSAVYLGMGAVMQATLDADARELSAATAMLERALDMDSTRADAYFLLGVAYQQLGATGDAIAPLEHALRLDPARPEALRALAQSYGAEGRDPAAVESLYVRALALQPRLAWMRAEYAALLEADGQRDRAIAEYRSALSEQPNLAVAWFGLGTTLAAAGDRAGETAALRQAVTLDPSLQQAARTLIDVRTRGTTVLGVRNADAPALLRAPRPALPSRIMADATLGGEGMAILFEDARPGGTVQVLRPDGSVVRTLTAGKDRAVRWDLATSAGALVGGGLYRVRIAGRGGAGRPQPPQLLAFGVVRRHE